jgi:hypothetical protein
MHSQFVVIVNEAEPPEFVHEEIHALAGCPNHFRQSLLTHVWDHFLGPAFFPKLASNKRARASRFSLELNS